MESLQTKNVAELDAFVVGRVGELKGEDPEIGEVLPVDPGKALCDHCAQAQISRSKCGELPAGSLTVIVSADDDVPGAVLDGSRLLRVLLVDLPKGEFGNLWDVAAIGEHSLTSRKDLI